MTDDDCSSAFPVFNQQPVLQHTGYTGPKDKTPALSLSDP